MDGRTLTFEDSLTVRQQWQDGHFELGSGNVITMFPQFLNPRFPSITNKQVRKALMHALNRQEMVDTIQGGQSQVADLYLGPDQREYQYVERSIARYPYDPRRAAQLIEDAGYVKGPDGFYYDPPAAGGERLTTDLRLGPAPVNQKPGLAVADYWQRVGVAVDLSVLPLQRQQDREYNNTFPGLYLIRTGRGVTDFLARHSARQPLASNDWTGTNRGHYVNPEFDALADRYFVTIPFADRMSILSQLVRIDTDDVTTLRLYFDPEATAVANRLKNVPPGAPWNAHEWDLTL
jgi:peptide/nickel transport system substrate-binding protein